MYKGIITVLVCMCVLTKGKITEQNKMEVGNEMEIFIVLTKFNICQRCEGGKPQLVVTT